MNSIVDTFTALGSNLASFGKTSRTCEIIAQAICDNPWFTETDILRAVDAIRREMLDYDKLSRWIANYPTPATTTRNVAVIMAGNIPLVGFFDLLCIIASGHRCYVKSSSKDRVMMEYIIGELKTIDPTLPIFNYSPADSYDMAIATGGDDANRYFREHFAHTRTLLRGSRHSVTILDGNESDDELRALTDDITSYSGLGCRSVSMIFTPQGTTPSLPDTKSINSKLERNTRSMRAMLAMQGHSFRDYGAFLAIQGREFPTSLSLVTLREYSSIEEVKRWLSENSGKVQCIVTHIKGIEHAIQFGEAQYPTLWDYADGVDTMHFLLNE